jgi:PAS domain S-box-containing protein
MLSSNLKLQESIAPVLSELVSHKGQAESLCIWVVAPEHLASICHLFMLANQLKYDFQKDITIQITVSLAGPVPSHEILLNACLGQHENTDWLEGNNAVVLERALKEEVVLRATGYELGLGFSEVDLICLERPDDFMKQSKHQITVYTALARNGFLYLVNEPQGKLESAYFQPSPYQGAYQKSQHITGNADIASAFELIGQLKKELRKQSEAFEGLSEEIEAYNHELEASNEELRVINEEIIQTYNQLCNSNNALQKSEMLINSVFNTADIGICIIDSEGRFLKVNKGFCSLYGYTEAAMMGLSLQDLMPEEDREKGWAAFTGFLDTGVEELAETVALRADGSYIDVFVTGSLLLSPEGKKYQVRTVRDITESKKNRNILNITLQSLKIGGWEYDGNTGEFSCTDEMFQIYERDSKSGFFVTLFFNTIVEEDRVRVRKNLEEAIYQGSKADLETRIVVEGKLKWVRITCNPEVSGHWQGKVYGTVQDITESKLTEEAMLKNERMYAALTKNFPNGTIDIIDQELKYVFTGGQELEELPQRPEEVIGKSIYELYPDELSMQLEGHFKQCLSGETVTFDIQFKGKHWIATAVPLTDPTNHVHQVMLLTQNITDKKKADLGLKETHKSLSDFRKALDVASLVMITDQTGKVTYVNQNMVALSSYPSEEMLGLDYRQLLAGSPDVPIHELLPTHEIWKGELRFRQKDGNYFWVNANIIPFTDESGQAEQFLFISNDITERKLFEEQLKLHNEELKKINAELDRFVYSASHDLRAPLVSILGLLNVARLDTEDQTKEKYFDMMELSVNKLDRFVKEIINYSRNSRLDIKLEKIEFRSLVQDVFDNFRYMEGADKVQLHIDIASESDFYSDSSRINVIFNNLISNAIRYRSHRREQHQIGIRVQVTRQEANIVVSDNGIGISPEYIGRIFEMFFRASYDNTGSGLGLYIVKESLNTLKGHIKVESVQGQGTTFTINIPNGVKNLEIF